MNLREEAKEIFDKYYYLFPNKTKLQFGYHEAKKCAILHVEGIIKFGNEMNIREPMMKYNKILEELKKI